MVRHIRKHQHQNIFIEMKCIPYILESSGFSACFLSSFQSHPTFRDFIDYSFQYFTTFNISWFKAVFCLMEPLKDVICCSCFVVSSTVPSIIDFSKEFKYMT